MPPLSAFAPGDDGRSSETSEVSAERFELTAILTKCRDLSVAPSGFLGHRSASREAGT